MPTHGPDLSRLNISQLAQLTGKDRATVRKDLADLEPVRKTGNALYFDAREALAHIFTGKSLDLTQERARLAREQADAQELKNAQLRGDLIPAEDFEAALVSLTSPIALRLSAIPTKAAPEVRSATTDAEGEETLRKHIEEATTELADLAARYAEAEASARGRSARDRARGAAAAA